MFTRTMGSVHMRFECDCAKLHNQRLVLIRVILFFFRCTWVDRDSSERVITPFSAPSSSCFFQVESTGFHFDKVIYSWLRIMDAYQFFLTSSVSIGPSIRFQALAAGLCRRVI